MSLRTVWRWLDDGRQGRMEPAGRQRFRITDELHGRLAAWCGNAAALHRELVGEYAAAVAEGREVDPVPSLATLHRAIRLDLNAGQRAALVGGERARRRHDVHLRRPRQWRNACWEADHKHVPVEVLLDGELVFPWVTWFIDCATETIPGAAVSPHQPSRDAILASLRIALSRNEDPTGPYGPIGGLPSLVRIDRGADFLSATVADALGHFAVPVQPLPPNRPDLKGSIENLNRCAEKMLFASLPRCTHAPSTRLRPGARGKHALAAEPLPFAEFVRLLLQWVTWWNTEHTELDIRLSVGRTGQCWDNALAESFFATLQNELFGDRPWPSRSIARTAVFEWIEGWYNLHGCTAASATAAPPTTKPPWRPDHHTDGVRQSGASSGFQSEVGRSRSHPQVAVLGDPVLSRAADNAGTAV
ncbi:integrase core domain-containing protein [Streptomyces sp. NPDC001275]